MLAQVPLGASMIFMLQVSDDALDLIADDSAETFMNFTKYIPATRVKELLFRASGIIDPHSNRPRKRRGRGQIPFLDPTRLNAFSSGSGGSGG